MNRGWAFLATNHGGVGDDWSQIAAGAKRLSEHGAESLPGPERIETAFDEMQGFLSQVLYIRALGALLPELIADTSKIARTFTVKIEGEQADRIVIGTPLAG